MLQFDKTGSGDLAAADLSHRYLWGPLVDQLMADEQVSSLSSPGSVVWPLADNLGTIRDLAVYNSATDATSVANHRIYDAFGNLKSQSNAAVDCLFGYTGRPFDKAGGLQYNTERWYDSATGRWLSEDPIGYKGGDINLYRYVGNDPQNWIDPTGEAEHRKIRPSTENKHEEANTRRKTDRGGEKGDANRDPPRKRPPDHRGPWPPVVKTIIIGAIAGTVLGTFAFLFISAIMAFLAPFGI